ncbi:MAG: hypothetical protein EA377_05730 [Phycisphaerales bacterium]|nr:MAG: hypothetical protein EA377_05730 [Phycisphaerales bacterium]
MNLIDWITWLVWGLFGLTYLSMVFLLWWALFGDRARHRRRCPKCWYDLSYTEGMRCTECGFAATREAQLHRTRRRPIWAVFAVTVCLALSVLINERTQQQGWSGLIPTRALVIALPWSGQPPNPVLDELGRRMQQMRLTSSQWETVIVRAVEGDRWAQPLDDNWQQKYAPMLDFWRYRNRPSGVNWGSVNPRNDEAAADHDFADWLFELPPLVLINLPQHLPAEYEPFVNLSIRDWWPIGTRTRVRIMDSRRPDEPLMTVFHGSQLPQRNSLILPLPADAREIEPFLLNIHFDHFDAAKEVWNETHVVHSELALAQIDTRAEPLRPIESEEAEQVIRSAVRGEIVRWGEGIHPVRFRYMPQRTFVAELDDVAIGIEVTLKRDGEKARQITMWWMAGSNIANLQLDRNRNFGYEVTYENHDLLFGPGGQDAEWTMDVVGKPSIAARAQTVGSYWSGAYTVPAEFRDSGRVAPTPESWRPEHDPDYVSGEVPAPIKPFDPDDQDQDMER